MTDPSNEQPADDVRPELDDQDFEKSGQVPEPGPTQIIDEDDDVELADDQSSESDLDWVEDDDEDASGPENFGGVSLDALGAVATKELTTVAKFLQVAANEVGEREGRNNDNKYGRYFDQNNAAWCAQFVSWCAEKAGATRDALFPETAWCPDLLAFARKNKLIIRDPVKDDRSGTPEPGDIMLVQRRPGEEGYSKNGAKHVGIVEKYLGNNKIQTIEGNTSTNGSAQGNGVYRLVRTLTDQIVIFRPKYIPAKKKQITINGKRYEDISTVTVRWINDRRASGAFSRHIYYLQDWLKKLGYKITEMDGKWDDETQAALDRFRRERVKIDGRLLKGDDAKGAIGLTSLTTARDQAKSSKKVKK